MVWIGTNDVRAMHSSFWGNRVVSVNALPEQPNMTTLERNLGSILNYIRKSSPVVKIAFCTLPPMGEDLRSDANALIREANEAIERVAKADDNCFVIPVFDRLEEYLQKNRRGKRALPIGLQPLICTLMMPIYHVARLRSWNTLSVIVGNKVLADGLHLNEHGRDIVVGLIVEWLLSANVAKAIAVKN
jgi:lysophospholipase L1-like esterase